MSDATKNEHPVRRWALVVLTSVLPLVTASTAAFFFTFRATLPDSDPSKGALLFWGFAVSLVTLVLQAFKIVLEQRQKNTSSRATEAAIDDADQARAARRWR
ncbi:hypothetical protein [Subtercola boreus]|uniref:hypothetical protein n=1 Tax=Subtercola boreus TaxID=120213 RepID=UPI0011C02118|nr:hypothetical protein [Subtercola boreus]